MTTTNRWVREGLIIGLIAYLAVAVFYTAFDLLASRGMLFTVNLLGEGLFGGARDRSILEFPISINYQSVFWYNAVHLLASLLIGLFVMRLVEEGSRKPERAGLMAGLIIAGFAITIALIGRITEPIRPVLPWWSIVVANTAASLLAAAWLIRRRPGLLRQVLGS